MPASMKLQALEWRDVPVFDADVLAKGMPPVGGGLARAACARPTAC